MLTKTTADAEPSLPMQKQTVSRLTRSTRSSQPHLAHQSTTPKNQIVDSDDINMGSDADDLQSEPPVEGLFKDEPGDMNASESDESHDELSIKSRKFPRQQVKTLLKEVAIPSSRVSSSKGRSGRILASQSPSSVDSILSTSRDRSAEYDTPATSAAVTPAEILGKSLSSKALETQGRRTLPNSKSMTSTRGKRKREDVDELVEADALLAQALQEEEYEEESEEAKLKRARPRKAPRNMIDDSDEDSLLSDLPQEDLDEVFPPKPEKTKKSGRTSLPLRAARESAKKSITAEVSREVMDTDDSDDISFMYSDADLDSIEDADDDDLIFPSISTTAAMAPVPTTPARNQSSTSRRARLPRRDPQRVNNRRQRMQRRTGSRVSFVFVFA